MHKCLSGLLQALRFLQLLCSFYKNSYCSAGEKSPFCYAIESELQRRFGHIDAIINVLDGLH